LLFKQEQLVSIFKNNLKQDKKFHPQNKSINFSIELLRQNEYNLQKLYFTFDDLFVSYFEKEGFEKKSDSEKLKLIEDTLSYLNRPTYYLTRFKNKIVLSVLKIGEIIDSYKDPIKAINQFYHAHFKFNFLETKRNQVLSVIHSRMNSSLAYLEKNKAKLDELIMERSPAQIGNLIMAHLHEIPSGVEKVTLQDFYSGEEVLIKLKKDLSPQKNAEVYYKKAKKKPMEIEMLESQINTKENQLRQLKEDQEKIAQITNHKELEPYELIYKKSFEKEEKEIAEKFKSFQFMGFQIYVGRNADNNDELTQKFAHKNDLWLHAKDVTGSHVIIKFQAGKKFPKPVIEAAASLAAFYSKRKNESLCPVLYTEKKFVRKVKGAPKGQVKVEKETVIMVVPKEL
jgi:predicted ribosome quality control (RQC) complex YloA/Tae2 family protein